MKNLAVIPARGGSKRIRGKNIRHFIDHPIIAYSIKAAISSGLFEHVIVSTDEAAIAAISRDYGAETPFTRPAWLSDDRTGTDEVVRHAIEWFMSNGITFDLVCCLYATAPFIQTSYIRKGYEQLSYSKDKEFSFAVTEYRFPVQRALKIDQGFIAPLMPEYIESRSQDLDPVYHDAGQFYWGKPSAYLERRPCFSHHAIPIFIPHYLVQDIDNECDWRMAEAMYTSLRSLGYLESV